MLIPEVSKSAVGTISEKKYLTSIHVRQIDNGYILTVTKETPETGYQTVELAITSLPKLLKAIGTFLKTSEKGTA